MEKHIKLASVAWEAPQTALGLAVLAAELCRGRVAHIEMADDRIVIETTEMGISLGHFVFWTRRNGGLSHQDTSNRAHELGHARQSRFLGWLYLPLVGLPSVTRAAYALAYRGVTGRPWTRYYDGYPENWADRLGGVRREEEHC